MKKTIIFVATVFISFGIGIIIGNISKQGKNDFVYHGIITPDTISDEEYILDSIEYSTDILYTEEIEDTENVQNDFITTPEMAYTIADCILSNIYGKEDMEREKPYNIEQYDDKWLISGTLNGPEDMKGGTARISIKKNGQINFVSHGK